MLSSLFRAAHSLLYPDVNDECFTMDDFARLHAEVYALTTALYESGRVGATPEEEAEICLALLTGYHASFIDHGEKQKRVQAVLDRCWPVLDHLAPSVLKLRLLTACYAEVFDETLADDAEAIIRSWSDSDCTADVRQAIDDFRSVVSNPAPWEYIEAV